MGAMKILRESGVEEIAWDPANRDEVRRAYEVYAKLRRSGFEFFGSTGDTGRRITRFDKRFATIVAVPIERGI